MEDIASLSLLIESIKLTSFIRLIFRGYNGPLAPL